MRAGSEPTGECRAFLERLSRYIDGDLRGASRRAVEEHLDRCPCCEEVAAGLRRTADECRGLGARRLPRDVRLRARARIAALLSVPASPARDSRR